MSRIEKLQELLQANAEDNFLQHALALEYIKIGNDEEAMGLFKRILKNDPGYVGSYYHLGKLMERMNMQGEAIEIYETGMAECKKQNDRHAYNELQGALEEITS